MYVYSIRIIPTLFKTVYMQFANAYLTLGLAEECLRNIAVLLMFEDLCSTGYSWSALNCSNIVFYQTSTVFRNITIQEIFENVECGGLLVDLPSEGSLLVYHSSHALVCGVF